MICFHLINKEILVASLLHNIYNSAMYSGHTSLLPLLDVRFTFLFVGQWILSIYLESGRSFPSQRVTFCCFGHALVPGHVVYPRAPYLHHYTLHHLLARYSQSPDPYLKAKNTENIFPVIILCCRCGGIHSLSLWLSRCTCLTLCATSHIFHVPDALPYCFNSSLIYH